MEKHNLQIEYRDVKDLHPYEGNVKRHPKKQIDEIKQSIVLYGFNDPIAVDENNLVIEGHGRLEAVKQLKYDKVPVIVLKGLTEDEKKQYIIVHNKLTMSTGFDVKKLQQEMVKLPTFDFKEFGIDNSFIMNNDFSAKTQETVDNILNLGIRQFPGVGKYDIPKINPIKEVPNVKEWIGFNYVMSCKDPKDKGVHFFIDDYQFERVWNRPYEYMTKLKKFKCVLAPDFSPYDDMPLITQMWNHYRKHWLAAYWQENGIKVIPTIRASSDIRSLEWCLDGEPVGGCIALSEMWSTIMSDNAEHVSDRLSKMVLNKLKPTQIIVYGSKEELDLPSDSAIKVIEIPRFTKERFNKNRKGE